MLICVDGHGGVSKVTFSPTAASRDASVLREHGPHSDIFIFRRGTAKLLTTNNNPYKI